MSITHIFADCCYTENMFTFVFYVIIIAALVLEGTGVTSGRTFAYFIIIGLSVVLCALSRKEQFKIPKNLLIASTLFLVLSLISALFSADILRSLQLVLFYATCFGVLVLIHNNKAKIEKYFLEFIVALGFFFCLYSVLIGVFLNNNIADLIPQVGYQLVYPYTFIHNHLGDFLLLPIIICGYFILKKKYMLNSILSIIFFAPFFIFSYSRSAYFDLAAILTLLIIYAYKSKKLRILSFQTLGVIFLSVHLLLLSLAVTSNNKNLSNIYNVKNFLSQKELLHQKQLLGSRPEYTQEAIKSIINKPLFGVGPNNFYLASIKYTTFKQRWTGTAHNIFLEVMVENGLLAGILLLLLILNLLIKSRKNIYFVLGLALLFNFQTDYTYKVYSLSLLFFILLGLAYDGKTRA